MKIGNNVKQKIANAPLTIRLLMFFSVFALCVWCVSGVLSWYSGAKYSRKYFDAQMLLFANTLATLELNPQVRILPNSETIKRSNGKKITIEDDALAYAIFTVNGDLLLSDDEHGAEFEFTHKRGFFKDKVDDDTWRMLWITSPDATRVVGVGQELEYQQNMVFEMLQEQLVPWLVSLPFLLLGFGWLLFTELRPLRSLAQNLTTRDPQDTRPLSTENVAPEVAPLVHALNALFMRTAEVLEREHAFVSNAAHELRTPLAGLQVQAEVISMCAQDSVARDHALQKLLKGTARCAHLVEQLLLLSSLEASKGNRREDMQLAKEMFDFKMLLENALQEGQDAGAEKNITCQLHIATQKTRSEGYGTLWAIALRNIMDNAIRYTPSGGHVFICFNEYVDGCELILQNNAKHIPGDILHKLGQRFYRPAGQKEQGSGLGLAIVEHICTLHGATVLFENVHMHTGIATSDQGIQMLEGVQVRIRNIHCS